MKEKFNIAYKQHIREKKLNRILGKTPTSNSDLFHVIVEIVRSMSTDTNIHEFDIIQIASETYHSFIKNHIFIKGKSYEYVISLTRKLIFGHFQKFNNYEIIR